MTTATTADFLVELGTEELPPKSLKTLRDAFTAGIMAGIEKAQLPFAEVESFAAPRRLAVLIKGLSTAQPDQTIERKGPAIQAAYDADGKPTPAAQGFARANGVDISELLEEDGRLTFRATQPGVATSALMPQIIADSLSQLPIPKRMRWGASRTEFVRPVHWLVMLHGDNVVEGDVLGLQAGNSTRGHRFHANHSIEITAPDQYETILEQQAYVYPRFEKRRGMIQQQVEAKAASINAQSIIDEDLLDEVTALNEWPVALMGKFDDDFLQVPSEALISSMKEHQKYFHVLDKEGALLPHFITIANIDSIDPQQVIEGNEKVIRPRLADAKFFYDTDLQVTQEQRREQLKNIVFQAQLGSVFNKTERIATLAKFIAESQNGNGELAYRAGELSKSDLVSQMVGEFPELQGIMGQYYAEKDGEPSEVATTLYEQYMPRFAGDALPSTLTAQAVAIADKVDTITGIFGIKQLPTGSKDPFALRRASIGVLRIIVENQLNLDLTALIDHAIKGYQAQGVELPGLDGLTTTVVNYMLDRFDASYQDAGIATEIVQSVKVLRPTSPLDFDRRIQAVSHFSKLPEASALASANKRVANLLAKAEGVAIPTSVNAALLGEAAEKTLAEAISAQQARVAQAAQAGDYTSVMESLATLKEPVDAFFDKVMVNTDDEAVRMNRLALLKQLQNLFLLVADISLLQKN